MNNIGPIYSWFYTDMKGNEMFADLENSHIFIDNLFAMLNGIEKNQYNCHNTIEPKTTNKHNYLSTISCIVFRLFLAGNRPIFLAFMLSLLCCIVACKYCLRYFFKSVSCLLSWNFPQMKDESWNFPPAWPRNPSKISHQVCWPMWKKVKNYIKCI